MTKTAFFGGGFFMSTSRFLSTFWGSSVYFFVFSPAESAALPFVPINAATQLRKEIGLDVGQVILGHKSLSVAQIYAERDVESAQKVTFGVGYWGMASLLCH